MLRQSHRQVISESYEITSIHQAIDLPSKPSSASSITRAYPVCVYDGNGFVEFVLIFGCDGCDHGHQTQHYQNHPDKNYNKNHNHDKNYQNDQ